MIRSLARFAVLVLLATGLAPVARARTTAEPANHLEALEHLREEITRRVRAGGRPGFDRPALSADAQRRLIEVLEERASWDGQLRTILGQVLGAYAGALGGALTMLAPTMRSRALFTLGGLLLGSLFVGMGSIQDMTGSRWIRETKHGSTLETVIRNGLPAAGIGLLLGKLVSLVVASTRWPVALALAAGTAIVASSMELMIARARTWNIQDRRREEQQRALDALIDAEVNRILREPPPARPRAGLSWEDPTRAPLLPAPTPESLDLAHDLPRVP